MGKNTRANGAPRNQLLSDRKTLDRPSFVKEKKMSSAWKDGIQLLGKSNFNGWSLGKQHTHLIMAVATVEPKCLVPSETEHRCDSDLQFNSNSDSQVFQSSNDDSPEMDVRERLRRMKISKANKGNVPWNKGRKHSAETLQRIRERTRIAMQDPKVKLKLVNLGHAQSEETRIKIAVGVREGWQRRREKLVVQEKCFFEWQNMIAEASRKGFAGEDELQWDSYKILDDQLKLEWLESVEKRKTMPRLKGSKRAPKSLEQRRKISEAISAKWADPEYRNRVYAALSKYHGTQVGVERKSRRKPTGETLYVNRVAAKKLAQPKGIDNEEKSIKKATHRKKRNEAPSYKDPMASSKLEMIKKIRAERAAMETKKREATERAKLLIAEAEKAAEALEVAALKSPLAQASLVETRKLIAEAIRSIESIESGQLISQETGDGASFYSSGAINHLQTSQGTPNSDTLLDRRLVNGSHLLSSSESDYKDFYFDKFTLQNALKDREPLPVAESAEDSGSLRGSLSSSLQPNNLIEESSRTDFQVGQSKINGSIRYNLASNIEEDGTLQAKEGESSMTSATKTKKWVCGRLVEVEAS